MTDDLVTRLRRKVAKNERTSVEVALLIGCEFIKEEAADRIEELEFVLRFIANINYGNGPDVTMEHQGWAKRALGEKTDD
jgi:hypothetical protein